MMRHHNNNPPNTPQSLHERMFPDSKPRTPEARTPSNVEPLFPDRPTPRHFNQHQHHPHPQQFSDLPVPRRPDPHEHYNELPAPRRPDLPTMTVPKRETELSRWVEQTIEQERRGRRWAWTIACVLILIVAAQAAAIALMLPLRETVPYTILVDKQTGYIETARGLDVGALAEDQAVVESMVAQYVLARETFDPADFNERYDRVSLWSLGQARNDYVAQYQPGADNVLAQYRPGTIVKVLIKKIELLTDKTALIRFETQRRDTGAEPMRQDWQAVVSYRFTGSPMRMEDRLLNPLGFQVTGYRRDAETAADQALKPATQPAPALRGATPSDSSLAPSPARGIPSKRAGAQ